MTRFVALAVLLGCPGRAPPAGGPAQLPVPPEVVAHMREHAAWADDAREAVIRGDLVGAREAAGWMADHRPWKELPEDWRPLAAELREAADRARAAENIEGAASGIAAMAQACGSCHEAVGGPSVTGVAPVAEDGDNPGMQSHAWGARRMWDGLVTPSADLFRIGARELSAAPLRAHEIAEVELPRELLEQERAVVDLATVALEARDDDVRVRAYGSLLARCATCHRALEAGPR